MTNRWSYLLVIFTICFFSNIASTTLEISNNTGEYIKPRTSDVGDVDFGEYKSISFTAGAGDRVQWDYSTNPSTNITVMVMNETEYSNFINSQSFIYYLLLNGSKDSYSLWFYPFINDIWYIVFYHNDSFYQRPTELTYNVKVHYKISNPIPDLDDDDSDDTSSESIIDILYIIFFIVLIFAGAIVAIAYFNYRRRLSEIRQ